MKLVRLVVLVVLALVSVLIVAAAPALAADVPGASPDSLTVATALVVAWGWLAPLTVYRWIKAGDARMKAITMGFSVAVAIVALLVGGGGIHLDFSSPAALYATALLVYGEQQLVWTLLKDHDRTTKLVN